MSVASEFEVKIGSDKRQKINKVCVFVLINLGFTSDTTMVSGCGRELNAHFYASLKDT